MARKLAREVDGAPVHLDNSPLTPLTPAEDEYMRNQLAMGPISRSAGDAAVVEPLRRLGLIQAYDETGAMEPALFAYEHFFDERGSYRLCLADFYPCKADPFATCLICEELAKRLLDRCEPSYCEEVMKNCNGPVGAYTRLPETAPETAPKTEEAPHVL